jgi:predicted nucleotidyltransferase
VSLTNSHLKETVLRALAEQPDIALAILFGSVAASKQSAESDVDIAVDLGRTFAAHEKMTLISKLAETTGRPVDLVDLHTVGEPLLGQILQHGERILGSDSRYADLIRKHLFDKADFLPYRERILLERRQAWIGK